MITPDPWNPQTPYSPLTVQFMTGGQMGYMPRAQFLTPSEYGAFRTLPNPHQGLTPGQSPGLWQNYLIENRGAPFGLPAYTFNTYNPAVNQQLYMYMSQRRVQDQALTAGASVADIMTRVGLGLVGGLPGAALGMVLPDMTTPLVDRLRERRGIQDLTMARIVGGEEVNKATGMGFGMRAAGDIDAFIRRSSAGDTLYKEGDYRKLLSLGVEFGMFDYAHSGQQYKDILKKMRNSLSTVMEVIGSTDFKDIMGEFKRLQTMGADQSRFTSILREENMFSRMAGLRHQDMVDTYGRQGALIYAQAGLSNIQGSSQAMSYAAMLSMAQRQGLVSPGYIARKGGLSGAVQDLTMQDAQVKKQFGDYVLTYIANDDFSGIDEERRRDLIRRMNDGSLNPAELMRSASRLNTPQKMAEFQARKADLRQHFDDSLGSTFAQENFWYRQYQKTGEMVAPALDVRAQIRIGAMLHGFDAEAADLIARNALSTERVDQHNREKSLEWSKRREEYEQRNNPFRKAWTGVRTWMTETGETMYDTVMGPYQRRSDAEAAKAGGYLQPRTDIRSVGPVPEPVSRAGEGPEGGGHTVDRGWLADQRPENSRELARLTEKLESNGAGIDFASRLKGDKGGWSYGPQQMATPTMVDFMAHLRKTDDPLSALFREDGRALRGDEASFPTAWKRAAAADPKGLEKAYHDYLWKTHWVDLRKKYIDGNDNYRHLLASNEVPQFLYRVGIHARGGLKRVLDAAFKDRDVSAMSTTEQLEALRRASLTEIAARMHPRFQKGVTRGYNELADTLIAEARKAPGPATAPKEEEPLPVWDDARLSGKGRAALERLNTEPVDMAALVNGGFGTPFRREELTGQQADELLRVFMNRDSGAEAEAVAGRLEREHGVRSVGDLRTLAKKHLATPEDFTDERPLARILNEALQAGDRPAYRDKEERARAVATLLKNEGVRRTLHSLALSGEDGEALRQALQYKVEDAINASRSKELERHEAAFETVQDSLYGGWFRDGLLKGHNRADREAMAGAIAKNAYAPAVLSLQALLEKRQYGLREGWSKQKLAAADAELDTLAAELKLTPETVEQLRKRGSIAVLEGRRLTAGLDLKQLEAIGKRRYSTELAGDAPEDMGGTGLDVSMTLVRLGRTSRERSLNFLVDRYRTQGFGKDDLSSPERVRTWKQQAAKINDTAMLQVLERAEQGLQRDIAPEQFDAYLARNTPDVFSGPMLRLDAQSGQPTINPLTAPPDTRPGLADETLRGLTGTLNSLNETLREMNRRMPMG